LGNKSLILVAAAGFILSLLFAFLPHQWIQGQILWTPSKPEDSGALVLTREWPERLELKTNCERLRNSDFGRVWDSGGLALFVRETVVDLRIRDLNQDLTLVIPQGPCEIQVIFDGTTGFLGLTVGEDAVSRTLAREEFPIVSRLLSPESQPDSVESVIILTRPTGAEFSPVKVLVGGAAAALLLISIFMLIPGKSLTVAFRKLVKFRFVLPDAFILIFLSLSAFVIPSFVDDGWVMARTEAFGDRGVFGNLFDSRDAWLPQGFLHEVLLFSLDALGAEFIHLRLGIVLAAFITWLLVRSVIIQPLLGSRRALIWSVACFYVAFASAWLISLRAEVFVSLVLAIAFASLVAYIRKPGPGIATLGLTSSALAVATHQSGWTALGPSLVLLFLITREIHGHQSKLVPYLTAIGVSASFGILFLFLPFDLSAILENARDFQSSNHSLGPFDEVTRLTYFLTGATFGPAGRFMPVVVLVGSLLITLLFFYSFSKPQKYLWSASVLSLTGLLFTSSKWPWHWATYVVPTTVLFALVMFSVLKRAPCSPKRWGFVALLPLLVIAAAYSMNRSMVWGLAETLTTDWVGFSNRVGPASMALVWAAAVVSGAALGLQADRSERRSWRPAAVAFTCATLLFPLVASLGWIIRDSFTTDAWSLPRQNALELVGSDECGVLSGVDLVTDARVLDTVPTRSPLGAALAPDSHPRISGLSTNPLGAIPTWGSWFVTDDQRVLPDSENPQDHAFGEFYSPVFFVKGLEKTAIWTATGGGPHQQASVLFEDAEGRLIGEADLRLETTQSWTLNFLSVPETAVFARGLVQDNSTVDGGWTALSSPVEATLIPASTVVENSSTFVGPFERPAFPCASFPSPVKGFWPKFDQVVAPTSLWNPAELQNLTLTSLGCSGDSRWCVYRSDYPVANVKTQLLSIVS